MPLRHQPPPLAALCVTCVARHFEYLVYGARSKQDMARMLEDGSFLRCQGPFTHMPSSILEKALTMIHDDNSIRHVQIRHLHVLLQPQLESLVLTFGFGDVHKALELLQQRCHRLKKLHISNLSSIEPPLLLRLTPHLTRLVVLDLSNSETTDTVVAAVGQHCPQLRDLNISCCPVSEKILARLFWDSNRRVRQCQQLSSVNLTGCPVTPATVREGLQLQPTLKHADFENNLLAFDPCHGGLWEYDDSLTFSLVGLSAVGATVSDSAMDQVATACPYVRSLSLNGCTVSSDSLMRAMAWENLSQLRLTNTEDESIQFGECVLPILTARGHQLTALLLAHFTYVDVVVVGLACPLLENLALSNIALYEPVMAAPARDLFTKLQALELWSDLSNTSLTAGTLRVLLRSCRGLHNLLASGSEQFSDHLLTELWMENPMSELKRITVDSCPNFTFVSLLQVFEMTNEVGFVRVWNCPHINKEHERQLFKKIKLENMDVYLEWFAWSG